MRKFSFILVALCLLGFTACQSNSTSNKKATNQGTDYAKVNTPEFNADSAYQFVVDQLNFGFRTPDSKGASKCAAYLTRQMQRWCDTVIVQKFTTTLWNNTTVHGQNIIASLDPSNQNRILIAAHWDSRLWADHDPDEKNHHQPILGANDGASGVAVMMEMARTMSQQKPSVGIDFIFFDVEDQGIADWSDMYEDNTWCKGSQYWAQMPHVPYYRAIYGVLFDMVATHNPRFTMEQVSMQYAPHIMNKYWNAAAALGYSNIFLNEKTDPILDDHLYINQIAGIPTIDIVQNSPEGSFFKYWHTIGDNLETIDKETMSKVANLTMKVIYGDYSK